MTLPSQQQIDIIATQILLDAKQALLSLKAWNKDVADAQGRIKLFKELVKSTAKQMDGDFRAASAAVSKFANAFNLNPQLLKKIGKDLQTIDAIAQKSLGGISQKSVESSARMTLLSNAIQTMATRGKISIDQVVASLRTLNASAGTKMGKLGFSDRNIVEAGNIAKQTATQIKEVGKASEEASHKAENGFGRAVTAVNALRIAMGVLVSMLIFQVIQAFQNMVSSALNGLKEIEVATFNLINAEQKLSEQGIEITPKGLDELIQKLQKISPLLTEVQATELVSSLATKVAPALGLGMKEVESLSVSIALLTVRNMALGKSFDEVMTQVETGLLSGKVTQGINQLGVKLTDQIVKEKAIKMQLVENEKAYDGLSAKQQEYINSLAIIALLEENREKELENLPLLLNSTTGKAAEVSKEWGNFLTELGKLSAPLLMEFLQLLIEDLKRLNEWLKKNEENISQFVAALTGLVAGGAKLVEISKRGFFDRINGVENFKEFIQAVYDGMQKAKEASLDLQSTLDTPTGPPQIYKNIEDNEETLKALEQIEDKIQDIVLDAKQAQDDLDLKLQQKQDDLDLEYLRKYEDAEKDHIQKIEDINLDASQKAEDAKRKARETELKAEQDLAQKLKELRSKYLLDLEEALHARDARQVLRLMKEYKLEKQNILDRAKLEREQRKKDLAEELRSIEIERQRRIQDENIEYQRKLADLATAKAREQQELQTWYEREQEDIQRNVQQKLEKLLNGYIAEEKIHESEQAKIRDILAKYFAEDMAMVDSMVAYMASAFAQMSQIVASFQPAPVGSLNYQLGLGMNTNPFGGSVTAQGFSELESTYGFAEGGTYVADRPTLALFGERGKEVAQFSPLNRTGKDVNKVFGDIDGNRGVSSQIAVAVDLSPDLEGRIVKQSMDGVGNVIGKINNRKQRR